MYNQAIKINPNYEVAYCNKGRNFNLFLGIALDILG